MLARLVWGGRISLLAGVGTATASMLIGVLVVLGSYCIAASTLSQAKEG